MTSHDDLDETQDSPSPVLRGRDLFFALVVILTLVAMAGVAIFFAVQLTTLKIEHTATTFPSASPSASASTNPSSTFMATPVAMKVCTDIPDGRLHVRFAAGDGSEVRGYLTEGETVLLASETETFQSEVWEQITSPIAGWVNVRYLCKSE
jgi:hypothetical protein